MTAEEQKLRTQREEKIERNSDYIAKHIWKDHIGHTFNDKYKVMSSAYATGGEEAVDAVIKQASEKKQAIPKKPAKTFPKKLFKSNEKLSTKKEKRP
jgi:hypothetical protein